MTSAAVIVPLQFQACSISICCVSTCPEWTTIHPGLAVQCIMVLLCNASRGIIVWPDVMPSTHGCLMSCQRMDVSFPSAGKAYRLHPHRLQSVNVFCYVQFALSRKHTPTGPADPSSTGATPTHTSEPASSAASARGWTQAPDTVSSASTGHVTCTGKQAADASSASQVLPAAAAPAGDQQLTQNPNMDVTAADQQRIDQENRQLLQSMSPDEVRTTAACQTPPCLYVSLRLENSISLDLTCKGSSCVLPQVHCLP